MALGSERLRLRVRFAGSDGDGDEEGLSHEQLWAVPLEPGTFRLDSSSFAVPLAAGDVVRAAPDAAGRLQVVDVVEPCDGVLTIFAPDADAAPGSVDALLDVWALQGAGHSEVAGPFLATVWPGTPMDAVAAQLNADQAAGRGEWILAAEPHERRREAQDEIDFALLGRDPGAVH
jgi:Domain of unknown function (DUF4265)